MEPLRREDLPELETLFRRYDETLSFVPNSLFTTWMLRWRPQKVFASPASGGASTGGGNHVDRRCMRKPAVSNARRSFVGVEMSRCPVEAAS
jgi:hypothetical protein